MRSILKKYYTNWIFLTFFLLLITTFLTFTIYAFQLTYFRDDWYYVLDFLNSNSKIFHEMFSIDRPARGYIFELAFNLFGTNPFPFHLTFSILKFLSGISIFWLVKTILPKQRMKAIWASVLFILYPGYLWWVSGIEYLPMNLSVFLQVISICFSIATIKSESKIERLTYFVFSILTGWGYLALVDYAIGMEITRFLMIYLYLRNFPELSGFRKRFACFVRKAWINLAIPFGYLIWRFLFFKNIRPDTDFSLQINGLFQNPIYILFQWFFNFLRSFLNSSINSWFLSLYNYFFNLRIKEMIYIMIIAGISGIIITLLINKIYRLIQADFKEEIEFPGMNFDSEFVVLSFISIIFGIFPIIITNRFIDSSNYSHYALPVSMAIVFFIVGLISSIHIKWVKRSAFFTLILLAMITHHSKAITTRNEQNIISNFWWQVTWRISGFQDGVSILANYPGINYGEDADNVWGPANLLFSKNKGIEIPITYPINAVPLDTETTMKILSKEESKVVYRTHQSFFDFRNIVIMSQPTTNSCVHIIDGKWPRLSINDSDQLFLLSRYSNISKLIDSAGKVELPEFLFGPEPQRDWCYYYELAEIALEKGDFDSVYRLENEALSKGYRPNDRVEWMPFLQAAIIKNDSEKIFTYSTYINEIPFLKSVACNTFKSMLDNNMDIKIKIKEETQRLYCQ